MGHALHRAGLKPVRGRGAGAWEGVAKLLGVSDMLYAAHPQLDSLVSDVVNANDSSEPEKRAQLPKRVEDLAVALEQGL